MRYPAGDPDPRFLECAERIQEGKMAKWLDKIMDLATKSPDPVKAPPERPATDKQVAYMQSLISMWDPYGSPHYDGATQATLQGALDVAGVAGYEDVEYFSHLGVPEASQVITRLKDYHG